MKIWIIGWLKSPYLAAHYGQCFGREERSVLFGHQ
jgi:hypothetical protein